jgi:hypothetical protein
MITRLGLQQTTIRRSYARFLSLTTFLDFGRSLTVEILTIPFLTKLAITSLLLTAKPMRILEGVSIG